MKMIYRKLLEDLKPYKPGKQIDDIKKEYGLTRVIKLASNENPYGCSKKVAEILKKYETVNIYPDNNCTELREKLSKFLNVEKEELIFGNGSAEIISMLSRAILNKGDEIITCIPTFPLYASEAKIAEATAIEVDLKDYKFDLDEMLAKINEHTKIIYIANPNNPTRNNDNKKRAGEFFEKSPKEYICSNR